MKLYPVQEVVKNAVRAATIPATSVQNFLDVRSFFIVSMFNIYNQ